MFWNCQYDRLVIFSFYALFVTASGKHMPNIHLVKGAAANMFQKNAIGKFLIKVPIQMAGKLTILA